MFNQSNVVDVYIRNLRRKIDDAHSTKLIHIVRGAGYRLALAGAYPFGRIEASRRLVYAQQLGVVEQRLGDADPLLYSTRVAAQPQVGVALQVYKFQHLRDSARARAQRRLPQRASLLPRGCFVVEQSAVAASSCCQRASRLPRVDSPTRRMLIGARGRPRSVRCSTPRCARRACRRKRRRADPTLIFAPGGTAGIASTPSTRCCPFGVAFAHWTRSLRACSPLPASLAVGPRLSPPPPTICPCSSLLWASAPRDQFPAACLSRTLPRRFASSQAFAPATSTAPAPQDPRTRCWRRHRRPCALVGVVSLGHAIAGLASEVGPNAQGG